MSLENLVRQYGFNIRVVSSSNTYRDFPFTILEEDGTNSYKIMYDDGIFSSVMRSCPGCDDYELVPEIAMVA